jgi:hypothetical protein
VSFYRPQRAEHTCKQGSQKRIPPQSLKREPPKPTHGIRGIWFRRLRGYKRSVFVALFDSVVRFQSNVWLFPLAGGCGPDNTACFVSLPPIYFRIAILTQGFSRRVQRSAALLIRLRWLRVSSRHVQHAAAHPSTLPYWARLYRR